jgi:hypothetical protein
MELRIMFPPVIILILALLVLPACGHAPLGTGENGFLSSATMISQPEKSYVVYGHIHEPGGAAYYRFDLAARQTLHIDLLVNRKDRPVPDLIIMGPGVPASGTLPPSLQVPPGSGALVIAGKMPEQAMYEPFSPAALFPVASYTQKAAGSGTFYAAVYTAEGEQDYSFAPGFREEFTASEWLLIPVSVIGIHAWEGQSPVVVLAPCIAVVLLGIAILLRRQKRNATPRSPFSWLAISAGLLYLGGASTTFTQMVRALGITGWDNSAILTLIFISIPVVLGIVALMTGFGSGHPVPAKERIWLAVLGVLGLLFWAGLVLGPLIACIAAFVPQRPKFGI